MVGVNPVRARCDALAGLGPRSLIWFADWLLQSDWMSANKAKRRLAMVWWESGPTLPGSSGGNVVLGCWWAPSRTRLCRNPRPVCSLSRPWLLAQSVVIGLAACRRVVDGTSDAEARWQRGDEREPARPAILASPFGAAAEAVTGSRIGRGHSSKGGRLCPLDSQPQIRCSLFALPRGMVSGLCWIGRRRVSRRPAIVLIAMSCARL
jgi:hypothetical protein